MSAEKSLFKPIPSDDGIFKQLTDTVRHSLPNACIFKGIQLIEGCKVKTIIVIVRKQNVLVTI